MAKAPEPKASLVEMIMMRDGVWPAENERKDKGETAFVSEAIATILEKNGHAKRV